MNNNLKKFKRSLKFNQKLQKSTLLKIKGKGGNPFAGRPGNPGCHVAVSHACGGSASAASDGGGGGFGYFIP